MQNAECKWNKTTLHERRLTKIAAALLSGILLFCSFPPFEYYVFAWLTLTPLIYICFCSSPRDSFLYGLLAGATFWLASIFWLTKVSVIGWIFISFYCALYMALFTLIVSWWKGNFQKVGRGVPAEPSERTAHPEGSPYLGKGYLRPDLVFLFGIPAIWVGLEYVRAQFLTGFPWNLLGVSQYSCVALIQCADWGGVYLVSYLIVMGNAAFALVLIDQKRFACPPRYAQHCWQVIPDLIGNPEKENLDSRLRGNDRRMTLWKISGEKILKTGPVLVLFLLIIFLVLQYGQWRLNQSSGKLETIRTAAVQLNMPQQYKWSEDWANDIYRRLKKSTAAACKSVPPDLIVWPETALPDFVRHDELSRQAVHEALRHGVPLLVGSMDYEILPGKTNYYNSSFLFIPGEERPPVYEKRHLVLFGEYVPGGDYFPFLRSITGIEEDFTPGTESTVFRLQSEGKKFSVLICFEDIFPYLARVGVLAGARLLINQTNDAWFDPSWASRQHMAHGVFRCIENRVACLRATNTGLTCYIDRFGLIRSSLAPVGRELREPQIMWSEAEFLPENMPLAFYTRYGDIFALACAAFSLLLFIGILLNFRSQVRGLKQLS